MYAPVEMESVKQAWAARRIALRNANYVHKVIIQAPILHVPRINVFAMKLENYLGLE